MVVEEERDGGEEAHLCMRTGTCRIDWRCGVAAGDERGGFSGRAPYWPFAVSWTSVTVCMMYCALRGKTCVCTSELRGGSIERVA